MNRWQWFPSYYQKAKEIEKYEKKLNRECELEYAKYSNLPKMIPLDLLNETKEK